MTARHPRRAARTWHDFERRFHPIVRADGSLIWHNDEIPRPIELRTWWTILDCDGRLYVSPGIRWVNRIGYLRTRLPWTRADEPHDWRYD